MEILGSTLSIKNTGGTNAVDYQLHWEEENDAGFKLFHPEINAASLSPIKGEDLSVLESSNARPILPARQKLSDKPTAKEIQSFSHSRTCMKIFSSIWVHGSSWPGKRWMTTIAIIFKQKPGTAALSKSE